MKTKDVIVLAVAALVFVVTGFVGYNTLNPSKGSASKAVQVEVAPTLPSQFDQAGLADIEDGTKTTNFYQRPNLDAGHPNNQFFGSF